MASKKHYLVTLDLLQQAQKLLEQNQLDEGIIEKFKKASLDFESLAEWTFYLQSQIGLATVYRKKYQYAIVEELLKATLLKVEHHIAKEAIEMGMVYKELAISIYAQSNYSLAKTYFQKALVIYQEHYGENHKDIALIYSNLGNCRFALDSLEEALEYYQKSLKIREAILPPNHPHFAFSYSALGRCYHTKRNYQKALLYFQEALGIRIHQYGNQHLTVSYSYTDISSAYVSLQNFTQARLHEAKALEIRKKQFPKGHITTAYCYSKIAEIYLREGKPSNALKNCYLALELQQKLLQPQHLHLAHTYIQIGKCLLLKESSQCVVYLQKALTICLQASEKYYKLTAKVLDYIARYYLLKEDFWKALEYYQQGIHSIYRIDLEKIVRQNILEAPSIESYLSSERLSKLIVGKAKVFEALFQQDQNLEYLWAAFEHYKQLIELIGQIRKMQSGESEQLFLSGEAETLYESAIKVALDLHQETGDGQILEEAFLFAEKGKAMILLTALQKNEAELSSSIPKDLLQKMKILEVQQLELEKQLKQNQKPLSLQELRRELFEVTHQYEGLIARLEEAYPEYYQLKYHLSTAGIRILQEALLERDSNNRLSSSTLMLSYYVGENQLYLFEVTSNDYQVHRISKPTDLADQILDFQDAINWMDFEDYLEVGTKLYQLLLAPVLEGKTPETIPQQMVILRHHLLEYLPFEALLMPSNLSDEEMLDFTVLPYLIRTYAVSYHYSATLLLRKIRQSQKTAALKSSFLGFAPVSFNGEKVWELEMKSQLGNSKVLRSRRGGEENLEILPNTESEVRQVYELFEEQSLDAKAFLYASASKENLLKEASKHKFLLISTHGFMENEGEGLSGIYLAKVDELEGVSEESRGGDYSKNNYLLYTSDTYHLDLKADLVVLSSCSSGVGKMQKGEGMMAINRGFLYGGASNIIFTQFDIPDESSSLLVKKLFEYILEGETYTAALRKAKLALLEQEGSSVQDWAGYLLIGV